MNLKAILAALAVVIAPVSAHALSLTIEDTSAGGGSLTITDGDLNDGNGGTDTISFDGTVGTVDINLVGTTSLEPGSTSILTLVVNIQTAGTGDLNISASNTDYSAGAGTPSITTFDMNGAVIGSTIMGAGYVDDGNAAFAQTTEVASGSLTAVIEDIIGSVNTNLSDPFSMTIVTTIAAGTTGQYDAVLTATPAPVPVPAGILLMGTALAGFGVMRRRKKHA